MSPRTEPPGMIRSLMARLLPDDFRAAILDDLDEEFARRSQNGRAGAIAWYLRQFGTLDNFRLHREADYLHASRGASPSAALERHSSALTVALGDLRTAARGLGRTPLFTATTAAVLALGVGVGVTVFTVVDEVLLEPLAYEDPDGLIAIWGQRPREELDRLPLTAWDIRNLRENASTLGQVGGFTTGTQTLSGSGFTPAEVEFGWMTENILPLLGIEPVVGRAFDLDTDLGEFPVMLSHAFWQEHFGGSVDALGQTLRISQQTATVIGVLPPEPSVELPTRGRIPSQTQIWSFMWVTGPDPDATNSWIRAIARLEDGSSVEQAREELERLASDARITFPDRDENGFELQAEPLLADFTDGAAPVLRALSAAAFMLFVLVSASVANLMILRGIARRRINAVRAALGAGRARLARIAAAEGLMVAFLGAAGGLLLAQAATSLVAAFPPPDVPRLDALTLGPAAAGLATLLALLATAAAGLVPALGMLRDNIGDELRSRRSVGGSRNGLRALVGAEVAVSLVLLVSAGLLVRTMERLGAVDPGFEADQALAFYLTIPNQGRTPEQMHAQIEEFRRRVGELPGVGAVGMVHSFPLSGSLAAGPYALDPGDLGDTDLGGPQADYRYTSAGYLEAMGARLLDGRFPRVDEQETSVVIDELMAETLWPGESALGREVAASPFGRTPKAYQIVGVVGHIRHETLRGDGRPTIYFPLAHHMLPFGHTVVRAEGDVESIVPAIREIVAGLDPDMAVSRIRTLTSWVAHASATTRWAAWLLSLFAGSAVLVSGLGLYGIVAYFVTERTREIGLRMALGARREGVLRLVLGQGLTLLGAGTLVGLLGTVFVTRVLESQLFGITRLDPTTYLTVVAVLAVTTVLACLIPGIRAVAVDPATALRAD